MVLTAMAGPLTYNFVEIIGRRYEVSRY